MKWVLDLKDYVSVFTSMAAFLISIVTILWKFSENQRTIRGQLTDAIAKLNSVNAEGRKLEIERKKDRFAPEVSAMFGFFNEQRAFLVSQALYLAGQSNNVSDSEYALIAGALMNIGEFSQADEYFKKASDRSGSPVRRSQNMRKHAGLLFRDGQYEYAREMYKRSIDELSEENDYTLHSRGDILLFWGKQEYEAGFTQDASDKFNKSKEYFNSVKSYHLKYHGISLHKEITEDVISKAGPAANENS